jgi:serine/threonine protein kinase
MTEYEDKLIGQRFGEGGCLVIQTRLGEGGMGTVYKAWDERNERPVAIKFLHMDTMADREALSRFKREGRKFGMLRHPNLVRVYALGREHGRIYIASEFVAGRNLYQILTEDGVFAVEWGLNVIRDVARGLQLAHENQVIHRDLKPENVMIGEDKVVKVLDFGIAKDLDASIVLTRQGTYLGTPAYSAPEQIRGDDIDHRADIFSLGVILYELLTGQVAFQGRHTTDVLRATLKEDPIPISRLNESVVSPVAQLIERMIRKNPKKRPATMNEVADGCDALLAALSDGYSIEEKQSVRTVLKRIFEGWRKGA